MAALERLQKKIIACKLCPRLRAHCLKVAKEKRASFAGEIYWGKPIPSWGDPHARLLIVGLAPAAHGANRTGRMFTGDRSGDWLYRAMHKAGFANQPTSTHAKDGLELHDAWITASAHCAPPDNKPLPEELENCARHLREELALMSQAKVYLVLGGIALNALWPLLGESQKKPKFGHGAELSLREGRTLLMSYHPSQQNTFTGRLTEPMFDGVFKRARKLVANMTRSGD
jgi:uracil-DNA glycosylase family 4